MDKRTFKNAINKEEMMARSCALAELYIEEKHKRDFISIRHPIRFMKTGFKQYRQILNSTVMSKLVSSLQNKTVYKMFNSIFGAEL